MPTISERKSRYGSKFQAKVRRLGHPTYSKTFDTEEEALVWGIEKEASLDAGETTSTDAAEVLTVCDLMALYAAALSHKTDLPILELAHSVLWETQLTEIQPEDILSFSAEPNEETATLQAAIEYARREFDIRLPRNPVISAYYKPTQARERRIQEYEEKTILDEAANTRGGYLVDAIIVALDTALMQNEIVKLDWSQIDLANKTISLTGKVGVRVIPVSDRVVTLLVTRGIKLHGLVFDGVSSIALQRAFIRTVERAKIDDLHFSDLRYESLCRMLENGLSIQQLWNIIGSKTLHPLVRILGTETGI